MRCFELTPIIFLSPNLNTLDAVFVLDFKHFPVIWAIDRTLALPNRQVRYQPVHALQKSRFSAAGCSAKQDTLSGGNMKIDIPDIIDVEIL